MVFPASSFYSLYRPSECDLRIYLRAHHEKESESSEFEKLIKELGLRHEREHLTSFEEFEDLRDGSFDERIERTFAAVTKGVRVIYQGVLHAKFPGTSDSIVGVPDFMIKEGESYRIRDSKLARHADERRHPEILRQLEIYGWLFEQTFEKPPASLEAYLGDRTILQTGYDGGGIPLQLLAGIRSISNLKEEPYAPVGWTKCGGCGFHDRCWDRAKESMDIAMIPALDQSTAIALRKKGTNSIVELLKKFDEQKLSDFERPHGRKSVRVGKAAGRILAQAEAIRDKKEIRLSVIELPSHDNMVMFDLEGMPPYFDELDKAYLWGTQVFGSKPGPFMLALAGFGPDGDKQGWLDFLSNCKKIFAEFEVIPFVHWSHYEKTKLKMYIERFGDDEAIAQRVLDNCLDLLEVVRSSLVLPVYSYSLKVIEQYVGFKRTMDEFGGQWSMAQYIKAVETEDKDLRQKIMSEIVKYNEEDLKATWAVVEWLKRKN